jgi:hypothetical protein
MSERVTVQGKIGRSATTNLLDEGINPYQSIGWLQSGTGIVISQRAPLDLLWGECYEDPYQSEADTLDSFNLTSCFNEFKTEDLVSIEQVGYKHPQIRSLFTFRVSGTKRIEKSTSKVLKFRVCTLCAGCRLSRPDWRTSRLSPRILRQSKQYTVQNLNRLMGRPKKGRQKRHKRCKLP